MQHCDNDTYAMRGKQPSEFGWGNQGKSPGSCGKWEDMGGLWQCRAPEQGAHGGESQP